MGGDRGGQRRQMVATFQQRDNPALGTLLGQSNRQFRHLAVPLFRDVHVGQGVIPVGVETGRDQDELGLEFFGRRNHLFLKGLEILRISGFRRQRDVQDVPRDAQADA